MRAARRRPRQLSGRGLAYWTDGKEERILYFTPGYRLIALNAKTGMRIPSFGRDGVVDLKLDFDQQIDLVTGEVGLHSTPAIAGDLVIVGAAFREGQTPKTHNNTRGYVRAFDVRTGKRVWIFHTIPRPGEFGNDTWLNDSWAVNGNTGVWNHVAVDEELGLAYLPVETPSSDFYGGHRPGNNLFAESLVAVDLKTGKRRWHYQLVHHPLWNMDIATAPMLVDINVNGKPIKAVAIMGKQAWIYVFDRITGQPVWPIEEQPVPPGDVPGEWYAPTQPHPTRPPAYDHQGVTVDNLIDFTPELRAEAVKLLSRYKLGPIFTPAPVSKVGRPDCRLPIVGRHELAGRLVRSRDARRVRAVVHLDGAARAAAAAEQGVLGRELRDGHRDQRRSLRLRARGRRRRRCARADAQRGADGPYRRRRGQHQSERPAVPQAALRPASPRSISIAATSSGRSPTARRPTTSATIRR